MATSDWLMALSNAVCVIAGVLLGLALADVSRFDEWLSQWQTLIAGLLAIAAALITVSQMQLTDERQNSRHSELVKVGLRAERIKVARASDYAASEFRRDAARLADLIHILLPATLTPRWEPSPDLVGEIRALGAVTTRLNYLAKNPAIIDAEPLFNAAMVKTRERILACGYVDHTGEAVFRQILGLEIKSIFYADGTGQTLTTWSRVARLPEYCVEFADQLERLKADYS